MANRQSIMLGRKLTGSTTTCSYFEFTHHYYDLPRG
uniref:Uncharacterized protein n=1 Tax=Arundo donax TaxID=35708 RepID=A0A0A9GSE8_ARUDO